ncbi:MAG TPA: phosphopantothenoylcysteine decarboxylase, partial [bacterium]|nr:phosphopantothenoylcysteine decarboxylase [bacterium]
KNKKKQIIVGFAAETENLIENAKLKMQKKNCDLLIANSTENIGKSTNKIFVLSKDNIQEFSETAKQETAKIIVSAILKKINEYTN